MLNDKNFVAVVKEVVKFWIINKMFVESEEYKGYKIEYLDYLEYPNYLRYGYYTFKVLDIKSGYEIATGSAQSFELAQAQAKKKVDYFCQIIT